MERFCSLTDNILDNYKKLYRHVYRNMIFFCVIVWTNSHYWNEELVLYVNDIIVTTFY